MTAPSRILALLALPWCPVLAQTVTATATALTPLTATAALVTSSLPSGTDLTPGADLTASDVRLGVPGIGGWPHDLIFNARTTVALSVDGGGVTYRVGERAIVYGLTQLLQQPPYGCSTGSHETLLRLTSPSPVRGMLRVELTSSGFAQVDVGNDGSFEFSAASAQVWTLPLTVSGVTDIRTRTSSSYQQDATLDVRFEPSGRLIGIESDRNVWDIDPITGVRTQLGTVPSIPSGITYDAATGRLYFMNNNSFLGSRLYVLDVLTWSTTLIGTALAPGASMVAIEWDRSTNTLYGVTHTALYTIDTNTAASTLVGPTNGPSGATALSSLCYDPVRDALWMTNSSTDSLYSVDRASGNVTLVGPLTGSPSSTRPSGLAHDGVGSMYLVDDVQDNLYTVDHASGAVTVVTPMGASAFVALAFLPHLEQIYSNGPIVTDRNGGFAGNPVSVLQNASPPQGLSHTNFGYTADSSHLADDFAVNGTWAIDRIKLFAYTTWAASPSCTGVYVEILSGGPPGVGTPVPGSPDFSANLFAAAGYAVSNTMTATRRVTQNTMTDNSRIVQAVEVNLPEAITLQTGVYWLRFKFDGLQYVPPLTTPFVNATGNAVQALGGALPADPIFNGTGPQGLPFELRYHAPGHTPGAITELGGGCDAATLRVEGSPALGGYFRATLDGSSPGMFPMIILGFTDPNGPLFVCPCTSHASLDVLQFGTTFDLAAPMNPAFVGLELFVQGAQLDLFAVGGTPCNLGIQFGLTNAFSWRAY